MGFFESFDGTKIYYEHHGQPLDGPKPPILFCYGLICAMPHWRHQVHWFREQFPCILMDYRGHHQSETPKDLKSLTVENCAKDVKALVEHLKLPPVHLVGHSMGSHVGIMLAHNEPELLLSLVSVCGSITNPFETMFHTHLVQHAFELLRKAYDKAPHVVRDVWKMILKNNVFNRALVATAGFNRKLAQSADIEIYLQGVMNVSVDVLKSLLEDMTDHPLTPYLSDIKTPTLVISGEADLIQPPINQQRLYEAIPKAEWMSIPYGSHNAHVDMSEFVNLRIEKFFASLKKRRS